MIVFRVPGMPCGKGRPRFTASRGRVSVYTPERTADYEELVAWMYRGTGEGCFDGPIRIQITAFFKIPKDVSLKTKALMEKGNIMPTKKPDADNISKAILDGLNHVAYEDDKQVTSLVCIKRYTGGDPYVEVKIERDHK